MKTFTNFIQEKFLIDNTYNPYTFQPKDKFELREILEERLAKDKNANLNDIDVSEITDMGPDTREVGLFEGLDPHNIDISEWDVSKVTDMRWMFYNCKNFNSNLRKWNVSNVEDMYSMFYYCKNFNCDLNKWKVSKVRIMTDMFTGCASLKNIPSWYEE